MASVRFLSEDTAQQARFARPTEQTFCSSVQARAWVREHFVETLHLMAQATDAKIETQAIAVLMDVAPSAGITSAEAAKFVHNFVRDMAQGVLLRRDYLPRMLHLHPAPGSLFDDRVPMVMALLASFESDLGRMDAEMRDLFVRELRAMIPAAPNRQVSLIA